MHCNATRFTLQFAILQFLLMMPLVTYQTSEGLSLDPAKEITEQDLIRLGMKGEIYDLFKKRWKHVIKDLYDNTSENYVLHKREAINNCLYEEFKRRLDKFSNDLNWEPNKAFKRKLEDMKKTRKRNSIRQHLFEEYKRRFDQLKEHEPIWESFLSNEKGQSFERIIRSFQKAKSLCRKQKASESIRERNAERERNSEQDFTKEYESLTTNEQDDNYSEPKQSESECDGHSLNEPQSYSSNQDESSSEDQSDESYSQDQSDDSYSSNEQDDSYYQNQRNENYSPNEQYKSYSQNEKDERYSSIEDGENVSQNELDVWPASNIKRQVLDTDNSATKENDNEGMRVYLGIDKTHTFAKESFPKESFAKLKLNFRSVPLQEPEISRFMVSNKEQGDKDTRPRHLFNFRSKSKEAEIKDKIDKVKLKKKIKSEKEKEIENSEEDETDESNEDSEYEDEEEDGSLVENKDEDEPNSEQENELKSDSNDKKENENSDKESEKSETDEDNSETDIAANINDEAFDPKDEVQDLDEVAEVSKHKHKQLDKDNRYIQTKFENELLQRLNNNSMAPINEDGYDNNEALESFDYDSQAAELNENVDDTYNDLDEVPLTYDDKPKCCKKKTWQNKLHKRIAVSYGDGPYGVGLSASYPAVLTKPYDNSFSSLPVISNGPTNLLEDVARKMNTSPLELAQKITNYNNDPHLNQVVQNTIANSVLSPTNRQIKQTETEALYSTPFPCIPTTEPYVTNAPPTSASPETPPKSSSKTISKPTATTESSTGPDEEHPNCDLEAPEVNEKIAAILNKVLCKLEEMQCNKSDEVQRPQPIDEQTSESPTESKKPASTPDGTPCNIVGTWSSYVMGICLDIESERKPRQEGNESNDANKRLNVQGMECTPPKKHLVLNTHWNFSGEALKDMGGPFYIYTQKRPENYIATFLGFCRVCNGQDIIFGSWTFLFPSTDCLDISTAIETKRDILRRNKLESKRRDRFKQYLYEHSKFAKAHAKRKRVRIS